MPPGRTSPAGIRFIGAWEGYRDTPYNDATHNATIGYGHKLHDGPVTVRDYERYPPLRDDAERAQRLKDMRAFLAADLHTAELAVLRYVQTPFRWQWRFDATVSFVFNVGAGNFARSTFLSELRRSRWRGPDVWDHLLVWDHDGDGNVIPGLYRRRVAERRLALYRLYS